VSTATEEMTLDGELAAPPPPAAGETAGGDPEAPYGRTRDGKPRGKPGPKGPRSRTGSRSSRTAPKPPPRVAGTSRPRTSSSSGPDYAAAVRGVIQSIAFPLAFSPATLPDAAALAAYGPNLADALDALAKERPEVAAVLDKLLAVGPYGAVFAAAVPLLVQLGVNHALVPLQLGTLLGAQDPAVLVQSFIPDQAAA